MSKETFVRWQKITIDQLSYALNLIFTLTVAALAYWFSLLRDDKFTPVQSAKCAMVVSLCALSVAAIAGSACIFNRLRDFRNTAQRAANNENALSREDVRDIGRLTWGLFYCLLAGFGLGIFTLELAIFLTYGGKLE